MEAVISASRAVKSFGSSELVARESDLEEEVLASSRAALAPFFWRVGVVVKRRWGVRGWGCDVGVVVVVNREACLWKRG